MKNKIESQELHKKMQAVDNVKESVKVIFAGLLTNAIFAYMFYREFDEHIG